jgi:hypothetical protein
MFVDPLSLTWDSRMITPIDLPICKFRIVLGTCVAPNDDDSSDRLSATASFQEPFRFLRRGSWVIGVNHWLARAIQ